MHARRSRPRRNDGGISGALKIHRLAVAEAFNVSLSRLIARAERRMGSNAR